MSVGGVGNQVNLYLVIRGLPRVLGICETLDARSINLTSVIFLLSSIHRLHKTEKYHHYSKAPPVSSFVLAADGARSSLWSMTPIPDPVEHEGGGPLRKLSPR